MTNVDLRASDADRERVAAALRDHTAAGRLTLDELSDRTAAAYAARTFGELAPLTADLPALDPPGRWPTGATGLLPYAVAALVAVVLLAGVLITAVTPALAAHGMGGMCH